jgi:glucose/arabinose dehydrogenase
MRHVKTLTNSCMAIYCTYIRKFLLISIILILNLLVMANNPVNYVYSKDKQKSVCKEPVVNDDRLKVQLVTSGLRKPTSMAFLGNGDLIVLELSNGTVRRIINDTLQEKPLLDLNVSKVTGERGMLGVTVSKNAGGHEYVFLYFTESNVDNGEPIGNRLYRYEFTDDKLVNPKLLLDLPVKPGPYHNGGSLAIGPDKNVYITLGNLENVEVPENITSKIQNVKNGDEPNGSGGILRVTQSGRAVGDGIIGKTYPSNLYYAYGIRNSFGIAFDTLTGNLWDTENGPDYGDEINLVIPGFNSGFFKVQGIWQNEKGYIGNVSTNPKDLVDFDGKGKYSMPEFTWKGRYGPTALIFLDSTKLGKNYENDLFVGNMHNESIIHFDLTNDRNGLSLSGPLKDKVADYNKELDNNIFAKDFDGGITDLEVGPDGYLYVVSGIWGCEGKIYRIVPSN